MTGFDRVSKTEKCISKRMPSILIYIETVHVVTSVSPSANVHIRLHLINFLLILCGQLLSVSVDIQLRFAPVSISAVYCFSEI